MIRLAVICAMVLTLTACRADESIAAYGASGKVWTLVELDSDPFTATATLTFPAPGQIAGRAHCNRFFGSQTAPYPWFETGPLGSTKMACPDLAAESQYLTALGEMTLSKVSGPTLILSNDAGRSMVFTAQE